MTRSTFSLVPTVPPPASLSPAARGSGVFGSFTVEVVTPGGQVTVPLLPDWELRAWGVARLGDATLEARPRRPHLTGADLDRDLREAGYLPLGPVRTRRGPPGERPGADRAG